MDNSKNTTAIPQSQQSLAAMLENITPDMLHGESETGDTVGKEEW